MPDNAALRDEAIDQRRGSDVKGRVPGTGTLGGNSPAGQGRFAIWVGLASALPIVIYPFMKRITWAPSARRVSSKS